MAETNKTEKRNGVVTEDDGGTFRAKVADGEYESLYGAIRRLISDIFFPDYVKDTPFLRRISISVAENGPLLRDASRNTGRDVLHWTRTGSPLRALLVISVGMIALLALTGLLIFTLFFVAATVNAIIIALLVSLAAAGGFLALFFACETAIYIAALSVAVFFISTATISAIIAVLVVTGWIGFFLIAWLATKRSLGLAKRSLTVTSSALSAYSSARNARQRQVLEKVD